MGRSTALGKRIVLDDTHETSQQANTEKLAMMAAESLGLTWVIKEFCCLVEYYSGWRLIPQVLLKKLSLVYQLATDPLSDLNLNEQRSSNSVEFIIN